MSNKCVTVLAPNGRRQNVKVTPNTTVLQILEEVCKKQGFKPEDYDITHHNKIVEVTTPLRFTGLPNNAQLEMAVATRTRFESNVKVGLTLENGERLFGEFEPSESLWSILKALCLNETESDDIPAIVFMGQEVTGEVSLRETTLRSLGLTRGGAVLRFFKRSPGVVLQQANVSAPLRKLPQAASSQSKKKHVTVLQPAMETIIQPDTSETSADPVPMELIQAEPVPVEPAQAEPMLAETAPVEPAPAKPGLAVQPLEKEKSGQESKMKLQSEETVKATNNEDLIKSESTSEMDYEDSSMATTSAGSVESKDTVKSKSLNNQRKDEEENIIFLGERNAVVFDLSSVSGTVEDVPDDFFDLTLDDVKQLLRDHKRRQAELEEAPLLTVQQRELEKSKLLLTHLNQYRRCIVRVQFPDRLVLQGMFSPLDSFNAVMDFVRKFLQYPEAEFYLFVTPPKTILPPEQTLVGAGCVPCTLVHFGYTSVSYDKFLRDDIAVQITSLRGAAIAARQSRGLASRPVSAPVLSSSGVSQLTSGTSSASTSNSRPGQTSSDSGPMTSASAVKRPATDKVPKWFKPGK